MFEARQASCTGPGWLADVGTKAAIDGKFESRSHYQMLYILASPILEFAHLRSDFCHNTTLALNPDSDANMANMPADMLKPPASLNRLTALAFVVLQTCLKPASAALLSTSHDQVSRRTLSRPLPEAVRASQSFAGFVQGV